MAQVVTYMYVTYVTSVSITLWTSHWSKGKVRRVISIIYNNININPIETIVAFMRRAIAFLSGPWAHICDENKGFTQTPVTFLS